MPAGGYLLGLACFATMLIATVGGAWLLLGKRFGHLTGSARVLALAILATCGVLAVHLVPGILGLLGRGSVLVASALWLAGAALVRPSPDAPVPTEGPPPTKPPEREPISSALAGVAVAATVLFALAFAHNRLVLAPGSIDILNFHLPGVGRWIQTGSLWDI